METIFDHNPTIEELEEITPFRTKEAYFKNLDTISSFQETVPEYHALFDLESLFDRRGNLSEREKYTTKLETEFADLLAKQFNE